MLRLENPSRAYDWGSRADIPQFIGRVAGDEPLAEIWMGTHPLGPSMVQGGDRTMTLLEAAGELPFMFKILAADRPLSLQVHPNEAMARVGFDAEEAQGCRSTRPHGPTRIRTTSRRWPTR